MFLEHFNIITIQDDGNCLFRAINYGLKNEQDGYEKIKQK